MREMATPSSEELIDEGAHAPIDGWSFTWLDGRATEERPPWGYLGLATEALSSADALLDVQTGGGEVLAEALGAAARRPGRIDATESWPPNVGLAGERLGPFGARVTEVAETAAFPFGDRTFDLVLSRHPTLTLWSEVMRVLRPGGRYLSQQIGPGSNRELTDFLMGPQPVGDRRSPERSVAQAEEVGLTVVDVRRATLEVTFSDIGAVVYFLRKVIWTVPGFTVDRYRDRLQSLDAVIRRDGRFICHGERFLIEAHRNR
jgi:SAM-dependent methyltransferase